MKNKILSLIYPDDQIWIFSDSYTKDSITVTCKVPLLGYSKQKVEYITAENYTRCVSQASYLFAHYLIKENLVSVSFDVEHFLRKMEAWELYYREMNIKFRKRVNRADTFSITLSLSECGKIHRTNFSFFDFKIKKTVISGQVSFIV